MPKNKKKQSLSENPAKGGAQRRRRPSAQSETTFGSDVLFEDDPHSATQLVAPTQTTHGASPNPEHRRPTARSFSHKFAKLISGQSSKSMISHSQSGGGGVAPTEDSQSGATALDQCEEEEISTLSSSPSRGRTSQPVSPGTMSPSKKYSSISVTSTTPCDQPLSPVRVIAKF